MKEVPFWIKGIWKGYIFGQNGIQKGKVLDLALEPLHIKLCRVTPMGCYRNWKHWKQYNPNYGCYCWGIIWPKSTVEQGGLGQPRVCLYKHTRSPHNISTRLKTTTKFSALRHNPMKVKFVLTVTFKVVMGLMRTWFKFRTSDTRWTFWQMGGFNFRYVTQRSVCRAVTQHIHASHATHWNMNHPDKEKNYEWMNQNNIYSQ